MTEDKDTTTGTAPDDAPNTEALEHRARQLEYGTIAWNVGEAGLTIGLGIAAGSLALIGFGTDSLVEIFASVVVLWHIAPSDAERQIDRRGRAVAAAVAVVRRSHDRRDRAEGLPVTSWVEATELGGNRDVVLRLGRDLATTLAFGTECTSWV